MWLGVGLEVVVGVCGWWWWWGVAVEVALRCVRDVAGVGWEGESGVGGRSRVAEDKLVCALPLCPPYTHTTEQSCGSCEGVTR